LSVTWFAIHLLATCPFAFLIHRNTYLSIILIFYYQHALL
jgi:hypothetical protein